MTQTENRRQLKRRLNSLDGKTWTRYSISIWDLGKTKEEARMQHPALFPQEIVKRLIEIYTKPGDVILDPFAGSGSTLIAAQNLGRRGIGFEITPEYVALTQKRLQMECPKQSQIIEPKLFNKDARSLGQCIAPNSIDLIVTSPPYWDIHRQRRTADGKSPRPYSALTQDIGNIASYTDFLDALSIVLGQLYTVAKEGRWCILIVMDLRKGSKFYPFHKDCIQRMTTRGFQLDDIIIWDRRQEYHNLRPLGYPTTFRVNKCHEYILIFQKPISKTPKF
ncbi:MAG: DNA methyltransferase [Promethearchaeota archaeon]